LRFVEYTYIFILECVFQKKKKIPSLTINLAEKSNATFVQVLTIFFSKYRRYI
jgi:hypothetical protein